MMEIEWDGVDCVVCRLGGKKIASATSLSGLIDALEKWTAATNTKPGFMSDDENGFDFSVQDVGEMVSSRPF